MGHKVHPLGFRLGVIKDWQAKWYSEEHYAEFVLEDLKIRKAIRAKYPDAAISQIQIERQAKEVSISIFTARPGIVIGRGGQRVDELRKELEQLTSKRVRLNIQEIRQPELDAYLVARTIAEQIERRVAYRRAMKQALFRTMQAGAKGIRVGCAGRLGDAEIARRQVIHQGRVPLHTLRADIDYGFTEAHTKMGRIGCKVWIYRGEILPEKEAPPEAAKAAEAAEGEKPAVEVAAKPVEAAPVVEAPKSGEAATAVEAALAKAVEKAAKPAEKPATKAVEKKPAARRATKAVAETEEKPAKPVAEAEAEPAKAAEKKPTAKRVVKAAAAEKAEKPAKPAAKAKVEPAKAEEAPAKPVRRKKTAEVKAEDKADAEAKAAKEKEG